MKVDDHPSLRKEGRQILFFQPWKAGMATSSIRRGVATNLLRKEEWRSLCLRRKIGHFNPDFVLSNPETVSEEIQQIPDEADIIHFKDDEPISRNWNGLEIPIDATIVHTAGGSSFRGIDFGIESSEKIKDIEVNFNQKWRNQKRTFGRLIHADGEKLQVDGSDYTSHSHNNVWSGSINLPKDANALVFSGHQLLIEEGSGKNYDIRSILLR